MAWYTTATLVDSYDQDPRLVALASDPGFINKDPMWFDQMVSKTRETKSKAKQVLQIAVLLILSGSAIAVVSKWVSDKLLVPESQATQLVENVISGERPVDVEEKDIFLNNADVAIDQVVEQLPEPVQTVAPVGVISDDEIVPMAKMLWGETGMHWDNPQAVAVIAHIVLNRKTETNSDLYPRLSEQETVSAVLNSGQFYGVGNEEYTKVEKHLSGEDELSSYEERAWESVKSITRQVASGQLPDTTDGALFYDHLAQVPPDLIDDPAEKAAAQKFLLDYGRKHGFGYSNGPTGYMTLQRGQKPYLYWWK